MWVKFLKPKAGMAYFRGDEVDMPDERAEELVKEGFCEKVLPNAGSVESDLPADLPKRDLLIGAGLPTREKVLAAENALVDIKGITKKQAAEIIELLKSE